MDIKTFKNLAAQLPPDIAILMRGPTGVGKTELAKALFSELYDGDERHIVRIDMSEYTEEPFEDESANVVEAVAERLARTLWEE